MNQAAVKVGPKGIVYMYAPTAEYARRAIGFQRERIDEVMDEIRVSITLPTFEENATEWAFVIDGEPDEKKKAVKPLRKIFAGITWGKMMEEKKLQGSLVQVGPALLPKSLGGSAYYQGERNKY